MVWTASSNGRREMPLKTDLKGTPASQAWEKKHAVCAVWEVFAFGRNSSHAYVFPFPETDFCLGYQKFIMWAHNAGLGKDFGQDFSGFERDDLDEHVCFWSFFLLGLVFSPSVANTLICTRRSATFLTPLRSCHLSAFFVQFPGQMPRVFFFPQ